MKYKLKYQTRGKVESYIATATSHIGLFMGSLYSEPELMPILQSISDNVQEMAATTAKGLTAQPECEIVDVGTYSLIVRNTNGREVLMVWFERVYDKGQAPQSRKL